MDLNTSFWEDIPDTVLEELYHQLEVGADIDDLEFSDSMSIHPVEDLGTRSLPLRDSGDSLPSLFPTASFTDVTLIKPDPDAAQAAATNQAHDVITQISQMTEHQQVQVDKMRQIQNRVCVESQKDSIPHLQQQQFNLNQQIEMELKELQQINRTIILEPADLHQSRILGLKLQLQQNQLELYRRELAKQLNPSNADELAMLIIEDQPIPQVTFKSKALEDNYVVKLLTASNVEYQSTSKMQAQLVSEERTWKTGTPLENDEEPLDATHQVATFHSLKLKVSTRMSIVFLKFGLQLYQTEASPIIQSNISYPLIVITNESQWCDAAGKLLVMDCFGAALEVPWPQFVNALQHHFLKATRQEPSRPERPIRGYEFQFLHRKFFNSQAVVSSQQASRFWQWFGQVTQTLRFKRHIGTLWFNGIIFGLITKHDCNVALSRQSEGAFLIRFSESYAGLFAVAYVSDDPHDRVKHYLVKPEDTGSQKTLPDFLREKPQFKYLTMIDPKTGQPSIFPKDTALQSYYSKAKRLDSNASGYVLL